MCTITYLPTPSGFILTSNRDEALVRKPAEVPHAVTIAQHQILFPRDGDAGGTWVATADNSRTICLMNGAFTRHKHNPPYRMSRGLVVLDFFKSDSIQSFYRDYDLTGIEPFTIIVIENGELFELRWDGQQKYFKTLDARLPHIRCSATLYTPEVIAMREKWFSAWLQKHKEFTVSNILQFHLFAGEGDEHTQIRMSIFGIVQTVSITCIESIDKVQTMYYSDLKGEKSYYFGGYSFSNNPGLPQGITIPVPE
jgi:hypothetical protein